MRVEYWCRYCKHFVGELDNPRWSREDAERLCGINRLSAVERAEWIAYNDLNRIMFVQTVCDYCQRAVETHPEVLLEGTILQ